MAELHHSSSEMMQEKAILTKKICGLKLITTSAILNNIRLSKKEKKTNKHTH